MWDKQDDYFVLRTGKRLYIPFCTFGMSEEMEMIGVGADDGLSLTELTPEEITEIADYMIDLWQRFKAKYQP